MQIWGAFAQRMWCFSFFHWWLVEKTCLVVSQEKSPSVSTWLVIVSVETTLSLKVNKRNNFRRWEASSKILVVSLQIQARVPWSLHVYPCVYFFLLHPLVHLSCVTQEGKREKIRESLISPEMKRNLERNPKSFQVCYARIMKRKERWTLLSFSQDLLNLITLVVWVGDWEGKMQTRHFSYDDEEDDNDDVRQCVWRRMKRCQDLVEDLVEVLSLLVREHVTFVSSSREMQSI